MRELNFTFNKGLAESCHLAAILHLYRRRGLSVRMRCDHDKSLIFKAAGVADGAPDDAPHIEWGEPSDLGASDSDNSRGANSISWNLNRAPLPPIGPHEEIWRELCELRLSARNLISDDNRTKARRFIHGLPKPLILLHTSSPTPGERLEGETVLELYRLLLDRTPGSLVSLDWDHNAPRLAHARFRSTLDDWEPISLETLWCLMDLADLMICANGWPYHFAALTDLPTIGVWPNRPPYQCALPRRSTLNLVPSSERAQTFLRRAEWNLVEFRAGAPTASDIATTAERMLAGPRYLARRDDLVRDVQIQQFVEWCRQATPVSAHADRHATFDRLLLEIKRRFDEPTVVETGCIRASEDWSAGYATYLLSAFLSSRGGGHLHSVDIDERHLEFARSMIAPFADAATLHRCDSVTWLRAFTDPIDVLYLDSMDVEVPEHQDHCLSEVKAAEPKLHGRSLLLLDDTTWKAGWIGKGAKAVPWLLDRGWQVLAAGYQVLLSQHD